MQTKSLNTPSGGAAEPEVLKHECIEMDRLAHQTKVFGKPIHLRYEEFKVLWLLLRYRGAVIRVRDINEKVYGDPFGKREQAIAGLVAKIREKLGFQAGLLIQNVFGIGYRIEGQPSRKSTRESSN